MTAATAVLLSLALVAPKPARADTLGTPPNIIDYNRVAPADWDALARFERKAAEDVLANHSLPAGDFDAVRGWARNQVRTQLWANLVVVLKKPDSARTADEKAAYRWFQSLVHQQNIAAAQKSVDEFIKYSGLTAATYTTQEPVNFNNPDKNQATGGYCIYRAPGPYADDYLGYLDQTCFTASTAPLNFAIPMPSYDEFIAYGQYLTNLEQVANADFSNTSFQVAASLSMGASLALAGASVPIGIAIGAGVTLGAKATAVATSVFPHAIRAGTAALVASGAVASVVATAILFIVTVVLTSIQVDAQLRMGQRLKDNLTQITTKPPDVRDQLLDDEERAADTSKSDEERKPKYYPGFFTTFLLGTLSEADPEPCSSGPVIGGSLYNVGCVNSPEPAAVAVDDPVFRVVPEGGGPAVDRRTIAVVDPYNGGSALTRASGKGWFVHTAASTSRVTQSLVMPFTGWDGKSYFAQRIWDETNGYRFTSTPVGSGSADDATVTPALNVTLADGAKVTVTLVPSSVSAIDVTLPDPILRAQPATFSAVASGGGAQDVTFFWWFPRLNTEGFSVNPPDGISVTYLPFAGSTVSRTLPDAGAVPIFLDVRAPDGTRQITRYDLNVIDGRALDSLTVNPPTNLRVGQTATLDAVALSGAFVQMQLVEPLGPCGTTFTFPTPNRDVRGLAAGTCTVRVFTSGNGEFQPTQTIVSFPVYRGEQSITASEPTELAVGEQQSLTATASSALQVSAEVVPDSADVCTAAGLTVTATGPGTCRLFLLQTGDANYLPAPPVERQFTVATPVTVTAVDETVVYGSTPAYEFHVSDPTVEVIGVECAAEPPLTVGTHPIVCSGGSVPGGMSLVYAPGTLTVTSASAVVTVSPPAVEYSDPLPDLSAAWTVAGLIGEDTLDGELAGCTADGVNVVDDTVLSPSGSYDLIDCSGLTNPNYDVSYAGSLTVDPEDATVAYAGDRYLSTNAGMTTDVAVAATVTQADDGSAGDLTAATVDILLFAGDNDGESPNFASTDLAVNASGLASATLTGVPAGIYRVVVQLSASNGFFAGPGAEDRLVVYQPTRGASAQGGGWARDAGSQDGKGKVQLSVRYTKDLVAQGEATYRWRSTANGFDYVVTASSWADGTLALDGSSTAAIVVPATLTVTDPRTRTVVPSLSGNGHGLRMIVADGGNGGRADRLTVMVLDSSGAPVHSVIGAAMGGGNLTVRTR